MQIFYRHGKILILAFFLFVNGVIWSAVFAESRGGILTVAFLDVGQGDSIFIESPSGRQMLIDGGANNNVLHQLSDVMPFYDRSIDIVMATHPDQDHIGGLVAVLERFDVEAIIESGNTSDTAAHKAFDDAATREGATRVFGRRGQTIDFGDGATLSILYPDRDVSEVESNTASIIARLTYGDTQFLFTGDSPKSIERYLVALDGDGLQSDVLKVGHHGSKTSTDEFFLGAVSPEYAIISAGENNRYGHPHADVLELLDVFGARVLETSNEGAIIFEDDGLRISLRNK